MSSASEFNVSRKTGLSMPWVVAALTFMSAITQSHAAQLIVREPLLLLAQNTQGQDTQLPSSAGADAGGGGADTPQTVGQAPSEPVEKQPELAALQQPGVLTPKGKFLLEPGLQFAHSTDSRVVVLGLSIFDAGLIGLLDIRTVNRTSWIASLTGRYGITNRLEFEARVPYVYRSDTTIARPLTGTGSEDQQFHATGSGLGDVEVTARYQFNEGGIEKPYYVGSLRFKSRTGTSPFQVETISPFLGPEQVQRELPTGSGFYALQPAITVLYPSDPAVLFGSLNYVYNFSRDDIAVGASGTTAKVEPGNIVGFNFGLGLALNDRTSLSIGYDHAIIGKTLINNEVAPLSLTTHVGSLIFGYAFKWSAKTNFNLSASIGVTRDAPDIQISLRFPHSF
ncbi:MAG: autotransporter outer membrane beta-barrel domain-containing protein [Burkholderiales bacterium]